MIIYSEGSEENEQFYQTYLVCSDIDIDHKFQVTRSVPTWITMSVQLRFLFLRVVNRPSTQKCISKTAFRISIFLHI